MPPLYDSISHVTVGVCLKNESHAGRERLGGLAGRTLATIRSQSMASLAWRAVIYEWSSARLTRSIGMPVIARFFGIIIKMYFSQRE